jgi:hypothetical protein
MIKYGANMDIGSKVALSAALGGTAEVLGGGKFANGAVTGAYVMMFNHLNNEIQEKKAEKEFRNTIPKETMAAMTAEQRKEFYKLCREFSRKGYSLENHKTFIQGQQNLSDLWDYVATGVGIYSLLVLKGTMGISTIGLLSSIGASLISSSYDNIVYSYNKIENNTNLGVFVKSDFTPTSFDTHYYNAATGDFLGTISIPRNIQR